MTFTTAVNIQAEVFASVPDNLRRTGQVPEWAVINRHGAPVDCFLEGPAFDTAGNLYIVDIAWGRIFKVSPAGDMTVVAEYDGEPNGMKVMADGSLMVAKVTFRAATPGANVSVAAAASKSPSAAVALPSTVA